MSAPVPAPAPVPQDGSAQPADTDLAEVGKALAAAFADTAAEVDARTA